MFILIWLFFVNAGISILYLQEAIVTSFLLIGFLVISSQNTSSKPAEANSTMV